MTSNKYKLSDKAHKQLEDHFDERNFYFLKVKDARQEQIDDQMR